MMPLDQSKPTLTARALMLVVRCYQYLLSPLLGSNCRFYPTCSNYTLEAIKIHGAIKGGAMGLWRIVRCNPFSQGGYEPVLGRCEQTELPKDSDKIQSQD